MKTSLRLSALLLLGAALTLPASAAIESIKINADNPLPEYPLRLQVEGVTRGAAIVAVNVDETGRLKDWLVLGYTHELFAKSCVQALQEWRFTPAKLEGVPVPAMVELTFNFTLEGAVISANIVNHFFFDHFETMGDGRYAYRLCPPAEIDRTPERVQAVSPKYAVEAEKNGLRGKVAVHFYIDEQGNVRLPAATSFAHPYLADIAVAAMRDWRFAPQTYHGRPVMIAASQVFEFSSGD